MQTLLSNMRFLCDEARMLTGITVAYGQATQSEHETYGRAQEFEQTPNGFIPCMCPLQPDSLYDLASLTKLFTAVMAMQLVQRGALSLDECVGEIDRRFVRLADVRVGDVLGFRVSLKTDGRIDDAPDRREALRRLFAASVCETPAVRVYSDINAMIIKYIIEAKCAGALADVIQEKICRPIGLTHTMSAVPTSARSRCVCYNYEHRIAGDRYMLRNNTQLGVPHDPKALILSQDGRDLCGHAGLFSTRQDMVRFAQALLSGELLDRELLLEIGTDRTGRRNSDGTYRQSLGYLCFAKHPIQRLSEVPAFMSDRAIGLSGFTGNHLSIDPQTGCFVLFLGNRCHGRVSNIIPAEGKSLQDYGLDEDGVGLVPWPDGRAVPSSARYVYFKDARLHAPIEARMRTLGWL